MKASQSILALVVVFLIVAGSEAASTQSYSIFYNGTDRTSNRFYTPTFDLGVLEVGYSIQITITVPNLDSGLFDFTKLVTGDNTGLTLYFEDYSTGKIVTT